MAAEEAAVLEAISGAKGRGKSGLTLEQLDAFDAAVAVLEEDSGIPAPTRSPLLEGRWKLLYTTRPGTASPIQRSFVGVDAFSVFQEILLDDETLPTVVNVVEFGQAGVLRVVAEANTDSQPLPGFTPRRGAGLPLFGKSSTDPPKGKDMRIDFQFSNAAFDFKALPFKIPYPVPFKLLGDETKGFIDITYLSTNGSFRLSRGNKGTLFVLSKDIPTTQMLLEAIEDQDEPAIEDFLDQLVAEGGGEASPAESTVAEGCWRLVWSAQGETANPLQKRLAGKVKNFQVVGDSAGPGRLENVVMLAPGITVRACAACQPASATRTAVTIDDVRIELGPFKIPLPIKSDGDGYVDWLYLDNTLRVTRGNKGSTFVHVRS